MPATQDPAAGLRSRARSLLDVGRAEDAMALLRQALVADPDDSTAHCLLAQALLQTGDARGALDAAGRADLGTEWPHRLRCNALRALGKKDAALAAAQEAVRLAPELPETLVTLVHAELATGRWREAQEHALTLRRIAPRLQMSHHALGCVSLHRRDWPEAEAHFRRALEVEPTSWQSMNNLALSLQHQGRHEEAIERFHDAARLQPTSDLVQANLASSVARYAGGGFLAFWLVLQVVRLMANAPSSSPVVGLAIMLGGLGLVAWFWHRRHQRLRALHPTVQAFYAGARARTSPLVPVRVLPRIALALLAVYLVSVMVGRLVDRVAPEWDGLVMLGAVVAAIVAIVLVVRASRVSWGR